MIKSLVTNFRPWNLRMGTLTSLAQTEHIVCCETKFFEILKRLSLIRILWNYLCPQIINYRKKGVLLKLNHETLCDSVRQYHFKCVLAVPTQLSLFVKFSYGKSLSENSHWMVGRCAFFGLVGWSWSSISSLRSLDLRLVKERRCLITTEIQSKFTRIEWFRAIDFYLSNDRLINRVLSLIIFKCDNNLLSNFLLLKVFSQPSHHIVLLAQTDKTSGSIVALHDATAHFGAHTDKHRLPLFCFCCVFRTSELSFHLLLCSTSNRISKVFTIDSVA